jgi:head-tail adaptor
MRRPRLDRRLLLESPTRQPDGAGGTIAGWQLLGAHWAEVRFASGTSREGPGVSIARSGFDIIVRAAPHGSPARPVPGQRFRDGPRRFAILSVAEADRQGFHLVCACREEVAP